MTPELAEQLVAYYQKLNGQDPTLYFMVNFIVPLISSIILVGSALAGVLKYYKEKKRSHAEMMLNQVYAPLFTYILRQEYIRQGVEEEAYSEKNAPILKIEEAESHSHLHVDPVAEKNVEAQGSVLDMKDIFSVAKSIDLGLVPTDLLALLSIYNIHDDRTRNRELERRYGLLLRKKIIDGYRKYRAQLGLGEESLVLGYEEDNIYFKKV